MRALAVVLEGASCAKECASLKWLQECLGKAEFAVSVPHALGEVEALGVTDEAQLIVAHGKRQELAVFGLWVPQRFPSAQILYLQCGDLDADRAGFHRRSPGESGHISFRCGSQSFFSEVAVFLQEQGIRASSPQVLPCVVGASRCIREAAKQVSLIAETEATCLLLGETGTGKELFARAIHYLSPRKHLPFVPVNCGAIPDALFENEIFGHVRGAYTDARSEETGLLAYAGNGTLFLDEVDALSAAAQVKLLRVLQEQEYRPIGSARTYHTDVRIVAATNSDLRQCVASRTFREDLFHRLNVLRLTIPPLRDRAEDIPLLANHFVKEFADRHKRPLHGIEKQATNLLMTYHWPGNVRELQGVLQRAVLLARGDSIVAADLDMPRNDVAGNPAGAAVCQPFENTLKSAKETVVRQFEQSYLSNVLRQCEGNVSRAAKVAGKERRSFQRLLRKYCIAVTSFRST